MLAALTGELFCTYNFYIEVVRGKPQVKQYMYRVTSYFKYIHPVTSVTSVFSGFMAFSQLTNYQDSHLVVSLSHNRMSELGCTSL